MSALAGYIVLDFRAFDVWFEEDEPDVTHPRDPFHRIDVLASSRHVRLELDGQVLAESSQPMLLFERCSRSATTCHRRRPGGPRRRLDLPAAA